MKILMIFDTVGNICLLAHVLDRQQWSEHQDSAQIQVSRWALHNHTTAPQTQISKSYRRAHRNNKQEWEFIFIELQSNLSPCVHWLKIAFWCMPIIFHSAHTFIKCAKKWLDVELIGTMRMISPKLEGVGLLPGCSVYLPRTVRNTRYTFSPTDLGYSTMHWSIQIDVNVYCNVMWCAHTMSYICILFTLHGRTV